MTEVDATDALELLGVEIQLNRAVSIAHAPARTTRPHDAAVGAFVVAAREMLATTRNAAMTSRSPNSTS